MAKQKHSLQAADKGSGNGGMVNLQSEIDDSLVNVDELIKLHQCSPEVANWFMSTISLEQQARHRNQEEKVELAKENSSRSYRVDVIVLVFVLVITLASLSFSAYLIYNGKDLQGTLFAGGSIVFVINALIKYKRNNHLADKQSQPIIRR